MPIYCVEKQLRDGRWTVKDVKADVATLPDPEATAVLARAWLEADAVGTVEAFAEAAKIGNRPSEKMIEDALLRQHCRANIFSAAQEAAQAVDLLKSQGDVEAPHRASQMVSISFNAVRYRAGHAWWLAAKDAVKEGNHPWLYGDPEHGDDIVRHVLSHPNLENPDAGSVGFDTSVTDAFAVRVWAQSLPGWDGMTPPTKDPALRYDQRRFLTAGNLWIEVL